MTFEELEALYKPYEVVEQNCANGYHDFSGDIWNLDSNFRYRRCFKCNTRFYLSWNAMFEDVNNTL